MDPQNTDNLAGLKHSDWNPRRISPEDFDNLVRSMKEFGDLSGIVKNIQTGTLVGGNQRIEALKRMTSPKIVITQRLPEPDSKGTTSLGYIEVDNGTRFGYREVMWPLEREKAANIAANRIQGEFDLEKLTEVNYALAQLEGGMDLLKLTGQSEEEINNLLRAVGPSAEPPGSPDNLGKLSFKMDPTQAEVVRTALYKSRQNNNLDVGSGNVDAEALYLICRDWMDNIEPGE